MKPRRIQRQRTKGWKMPENTIYVGRPSRWGNPWRIGERDPYHFGHDNPLTAEEVLSQYRCYVEAQCVRALTDFRDMVQSVAPAPSQQTGRR